jgi:NTE family protein
MFPVNIPIKFLSSIHYGKRDGKMGRHRRRLRKLGLALGGGGARGGVHIGVLKVLEEQGVPVRFVAGTSIGAVVGALYASGMTAVEMEKRIHRYLESDIFSRTQFHMAETLEKRSSLRLLHRASFFLKKEFIMMLALARPFLIPKDIFRENLKFLFDNARIRIEDTAIPFAVVATDLETGEEVILREGPLIDALYASCTYPGVVESVRLKGRLLVDGGLSAMIPIEASKLLGSDVVLAVDLEPPVMARLEDLSAFDVMVRAEEVLMARLVLYEVRDADIVIRPRKGDAGWYDFSKITLYIPFGEEAAREQIPRIYQVLNGGLLSHLFGFIRAGLRWKALNPRFP